MSCKPHRVTPAILAALTALLVVACMPTATPLPTAISISIPTSKVTSTRAPTPTNTSIPPTLAPASKPTRTPRPTRIPKPTATPTPTPTPLPGIFRPVAPIDEELLGTGRELHASSDGTLWLIAERGVARLVDDTWSVYLSDVTGQVAGIDTANRVWVVSEDASEISAWDGDSWTTYGAEVGWTPLADTGYAYVDGVQSDALRRPWVATSEDVRVFDGEKWIVITPQDMTMGSPEYEDLIPSFEIAVLDSGAVWVLECDWGGPGPFGGRGVRWFDGSSWHGADSPVASGCATVIAEDDAGIVWLGVEEILWRYDPASDTWTEFAPPEPPTDWGRFGFVDHLTLDPSGDPWLTLVLCGGASCYGSIVLYHVHDGVWDQIGDPSDFGGLAWGPLFDADGTPWLFWSEGIYRVVENTIEPMASLYTQSAVVDGSGRVWFLAWYEDQQWLWTIDTEPERS